MVIAWQGLIAIADLLTKPKKITEKTKRKKGKRKERRWKSNPSCVEKSTQVLEISQGD